MQRTKSLNLYTFSGVLVLLLVFPLLNLIKDSLQNTDSGEAVKEETTVEQVEQDTIQPSNQAPEEEVLGISDSGLRINSVGESYSSAALISLSSEESPVIGVSALNLSGEVQVKLYKADYDTVLSYLIHTEENEQINSDVDLDKLDFVTDITLSHSAGSQRWNEKIVELPISGQQGIWYVEVSYENDGETLKNQAFVNISSTGVSVKEGNSEFIFWAQDFKTGKRVTDAKIEVFDLQDSVRTLDIDEFDSDGIATTSLVTEADIAVVENDGQFTIVPINLHYFNTGYKQYTIFRTKELSAAYFVYTDRPLYQPGETVNFKAVLRLDDNANYSIPGGTAEVQIYPGYDSDEAIYTETLPVTSDGTVFGSFTLPESAITGRYHVKVLLDGIAEVSGFSQDYWTATEAAFYVEYFRKPEFTLDVDVIDNELIHGEEITYVISGEYFSGQPLSGQSINYKVSYSDYSDYGYYPPNNNYILDNEFAYGHRYGKLAKSGVLDLDANGKAQLTLDTDGLVPIDKNHILTIEVDANDGTGNPSYATKNALVYQGEFGIYRERSSRYSFRQDQTIELPVIIKPRPGVTNYDVNNNSLKVYVTREYYEQVQDSGQKTKYPRHEKKTERIADLQATTDSEGRATFTLNPEKTGSYVFTMTGQDTLGNSVSATFSVYVYDLSQPLYDYNSYYSNNLSLQYDKSIYDVGDTINLTVTSAVPNRDVLVAVQRSYVTDYYVVETDGNSAQLQIPVTENFLPNNYVSATTFTTNSYESVYQKISVVTDRKKLDVTLIPNKDTYRPGEEITVNVKTTDSSGNGVAADLAIWAVDKAIFELIPPSTRNIFSNFWAHRSNSTATSYSLSGIYAVGDGGLGGGGGGDDMRSVFENTAYWNPAVKTDSNGNGVISFTVPDNLTTWVLAGTGSTTSTIVGQTTDEVIVTKDIIVRPVLPNRLIVGDKILLSALLQNFTDTKQDFDVEFAVGGVKLENTINETSIAIGPSTTEQLFWEYEPDTPNPETKVTVSAASQTSDEAQDAIELSLPVIPFNFVQEDSSSAIGNHTYTVDLNDDSDLENSEVKVNISPTLVGTVFESMDYLIGYPYGCTEQTTSRLVPAIIAKENPDLFPASRIRYNLDEVIEEGIDRLEKTQKSDGGWSWWGDGASDPFVTAYVFEYLNRAESLGYEIRQNTMNNAEVYARREVKRDAADRIVGPVATRELIFREYAKSQVALGGNLIDTTALESFGTIDNTSVALAAITNIKNGHTNPENNGIAELRKRASVSGDERYWNAIEEQLFESSNTTTALAVKALLVSGTDEDRDLAAKGISYLLKNRNKSYWSNTFGTAQVMEAAVAFARTGNELSPNYSYTVAVDGNVVNEGVITNITQNVETIIPVNLVKEKGSEIEVRMTGDGQMYSSLSTSELRTDREFEGLSNNVTIERSYVNAEGPQYSLAVGDTVNIYITVSGLDDERYYGVIEDELPAGMVPINYLFKNEHPRYEDYSQYVTNRQITENGIIMSLYKVAEGTYRYSYKARVINAGEFIAPPAKFALMYSPEINAMSKVETVKTTLNRDIDPAYLLQLELSKLGQNKSSAASVITAIVVTLIIVYKKDGKDIVRKVRELKEMQVEKLKSIRGNSGTEDSGDVKSNPKNSEN